MASNSIIAGRTSQAFRDIDATMKKMCDRAGLVYTKPNLHQSQGVDYQRMLVAESIANQLQSLEKLIPKKKQTPVTGGNNGNGSTTQAKLDSPATPQGSELLQKQPDPVG